MRIGMQAMLEDWGVGRERLALGIVARVHIGTRLVWPVKLKQRERNAVAFKSSV
jgi:hypothetical protein